LAKLEKVELEKEAAELRELADKLDALINSETLQKAELKTRLSEIVKKFGDDRRTELTQIDIKPEEKEIAEVVPEDCVIIISQTGDIKRIPSKSFKVQRKNGKGVKSEDDAILNSIATNTIDTLMAFTNKGKMYRLLVDNIPVGTNVSKGVRIGTLINMEADEKVIAVTSLHRTTDAKFVIFITKNGLIKKTALEEYTKVKRSTGINAINIKEGDSIANVTFVKDENIILITKKGMSIHFTTKDITPIGRVTAGVKAIKLNDEDYVIGGFPVHKTTDSIAVISEKGLGKKSPISDFTVQGRGGKGVLIYKPTSSTGDIAGAAMVSDSDNVLLVGKPNSICIAATDIPELSRTSIGNIMVKNSSVISVVKL
jgi:DNA gyrase subunit A